MKMSKKSVLEAHSGAGVGFIDEELPLIKGHGAFRLSPRHKLPVPSPASERLAVDYGSVELVHLSPDRSESLNAGLSLSPHYDAAGVKSDAMAPVKYYSTERVMRKARSSYLCDFACAFEKSNKSAEKQKELAKARCGLWAACVFCLIFMCCELVGGYFSHSLALMSDACHLLSDLVAMMINIFSLWLSSSPASARYSFGYQRAEILGAMLSCFIIWLLTAALVYEAVLRIMNPPQVDGEMMLAVACAGILVNIIMAAILGAAGHSHSHGLSGGHGHSHGGGHGHGHGHGHSHGHDHSHSHSGSHSPHVKHSQTGNYETVEHSHSHSGERHEHGHEHGHVHSHECGHGHDHKQDEDECEHSHSHSMDMTPESSSESDFDDKQKTKKVNINLRSALIHVIGDLIQSIGVSIAASLIWYDSTLFALADPMCTLLFSVIVMFTTYSLIQDAFGVLMESVPRHISTDEIRSELLSLADVCEVHDLHVWMLSIDDMALSVHLVVNREPPLGASTPRELCMDVILKKAQTICRRKYGISHATIQIEWPNCAHSAIQFTSSQTTPHRAAEAHASKRPHLQSVEETSEENESGSDAPVNGVNEEETFSLNEETSTAAQTKTS